MPAIGAQGLQPLASGDVAGVKTRVEQHVFLDETQSLNVQALQDVQAADFKTFTPLQRLPMEGKTVWLRLSLDRADGEPGPLGPIYLRVLPRFFESVILHTPDSQASGGWRATDLGNAASSLAIPVGELAKSEQIYLQIRASHANSLLVYAGTQAEVSGFNHRLDITMAVVSTMLLFAWVVMVWKALTHFSPLSVAVCTLLPIILLRLWLTFGYAPALLGLPSAWEGRFFVYLVSATMLSAGWVLLLLAAEVFQSKRWFVGLWAWTILGFCNLTLYFFDPGWAINMMDGLMLFGAVLYLFGMLLAAVQAPKSLKTWPAKVAAAALLLIASLALLSALQLQGLSSSASALQQPDLVTKVMLFRSLMPIVMITLASWTYGRLRRDRMTKTQADLVLTTASLKLESKRLERQRKFTAMLTHELKNPLTASQMALAGIQQRLARDDPAQHRAEKIKISLQEINAIVDRCAEVDGYEQGQMPMAVHTFEVQQLLDLVKAANPNERIYTLVRGLPEGSTLSSDLHYIKLILNNLLSNALKYSPPDSLVELQLACRQTEQGTHIDIRVTNEVGLAGVPDPSRLFERFYRTEGARNQSGAGLGLWLSQALAGALGTSLVSQTEDNWISFTLTLPLNDA